MEQRMKNTWRIFAELACCVEHKPEIVFYLAGADPFAEQTRKTFFVHDGTAFVTSLFCAHATSAVPVTTVMSGGYGKQVDDTVEIHCNIDQ